MVGGDSGKFSTSRNFRNGKKFGYAVENAKMLDRLLYRAHKNLCASVKTTMLGINKVIRVLILSDVIILTGLGFVSPIFAIFIADNIQGGDVRVAGFAASIY